MFREKAHFRGVRNETSDVHRHSYVVHNNDNNVVRFSGGTPGQTLTFNQSVGFVTTGSAPNFRLQDLFHMTINANGYVTSFVDNFYAYLRPLSIPFEAPAFPGRGNQRRSARKPNSRLDRTEIGGNLPPKVVGIVPSGLVADTLARGCRGLRGFGSAGSPPLAITALYVLLRSCQSGTGSPVSAPTNSRTASGEARFSTGRCG
jgi:hypothetical protein